MPHLAIGGFDVRANRGAFMSGEYSMRWRRVERRWLRRGRSSARSAAIGRIRRGVGDQFWEADVGEDADAGAADGGFAGEGDDGDAHPEGVAGGGGAVVGEGVEGDVDAGGRVSRYCVEREFGRRRFDAVAGRCRVLRRIGGCAADAWEPIGRRGGGGGSWGWRGGVAAQRSRSASVTLQKLFRQPKVMKPCFGAGMVR